MKIAVFGRSATEENCLALRKLCDIMSTKQIQVYVYEPFLEQAKASNYYILCEYEVFTDFSTIADQIDYFMSVGGDGTLLNTVDFVKETKIPVIGINTGRLGFLANFQVDQMEELVDMLLSKTYESDYRSLLEVHSNISLFDHHNFALNEFTLQKKDPAAVMKVHAFLNGEFLSSYWGDGVIISTPTGSTGYSLSANGSILLPGSEVWVITPISPHNLNLRPLVVPDSSEIILKIAEHRGESYCTMDSKFWPVSSEYEFTITKAPFYLNIIRAPKHDFIDNLQTKLMWGIDNRDN